MSIADSRSLVGGMPLALIWASWVSRQLSLVMVWNEPGPCNSRIGSGNGFGIPKRVSDGPMARTMTCFDCEPVTMNPPMPTWSPVSTCSRVERFSACEVGGTVGVAVAVAVAVWLAEGGGAGSGQPGGEIRAPALFLIETLRLSRA